MCKMKGRIGPEGGSNARQRNMELSGVLWKELEKRTDCYLCLRPGTLSVIKLRVAKTQRAWNCQSDAMRLVASLPEVKMSKNKHLSLGSLIVRRENFKKPYKETY